MKIKAEKAIPERITDDTGREILVYSDGTRKLASNGHLLRGPFVTPITQHPHEMIARRNELSRQRAIEAIDEGAGIEPSKWGTGLGWRKVIAHTVKVYLESKNIRGMGEVLAKLATVAGYNVADPEEQPARNDVNIALVRELLAFASAIVKRDDASTIEGELE